MSSFCVSVFMVSLTAIMLYHPVIVSGEAVIGAGGSTCKGQVSTKDKKASLVWILGKPAPDSFKSMWGAPSSLLLACVWNEVSALQSSCSLCPRFLTAAPGVSSITWVSTLMKTGFEGSGSRVKTNTFLNTYLVPGALTCIISFNPNPSD